MAGNADSSGWESVADAWEANRSRVFESFRSSSDWLVDAVDPQPGQVVLEVAAGPGETGFLVAERVGADGRVISTDLAPTMVEAARKGATSRGLDNVECRVMDARELDLPEDSVDAAICRLGLMLVSDPASAFRELRRVVRPGGRIAYTVIGAPDKNQWMGLIMGALVQLGHRPSGGDPSAFGGPFSLSSPEVNEELLREAGFANVEVEEISGAMTFEGVDDYWEVQTSLAEPVKATVMGMAAEQREAVRSTLDGMLTPFQTGGGFDLPTQVVALRAW